MLLDIFKETGYIYDMRLRFSQRKGLSSIKSEMQIDSMDEELRNRLWNIFKFYYLDSINHKLNTDDLARRFFKPVWHNFFKKPFDNMPSSFYGIYGKVYEEFFGFEWYKVYDFLEFILSIRPIEAFIESCNNIMEEELSAYRFINGLIAPITDKVEAEEIQEASEKSSELGLEGVKTHLDTALSMLSDRKKPDYRNSIKESISAVESLCRQITGKKKATLGDALKIITKEGKVELHPALKDGYIQR